MKTPKFWQQRTYLAYLLWPLGVIYALISTLIKYKKQRCAQKLPVPVIVVGNINAGGTGKTPVAITLIEALTKRGLKVGIISRGYGRSGTGLTIADEHASAQSLGDEPFLIYQKTRCPMAIFPNRFQAGLALLAAFPDIDLLLSDDGLQHYQLARTLEIAVIGKQGLGNEWLIPAGPLREKVDRLATINYIIGNQAPSHIYQRFPNTIALISTLDAAYALNTPEVTRSLSHFLGQSVSAVAGIAYPQNFFSMLETQGLSLKTFPFPDHHNFTLSDFTAMPRPILMTEKDAVKCQCLDLKEVWVIPLHTQLPEGFIDTLIQALPTTDF